jgi:hypothetical protein
VLGDRHTILIDADFRDQVTHSLRIVRFNR